MARIHTITVPRGTTYAITVNYLSDGVAAPITGATVLFTVKTTEYDDDITDSSALIQKTVTAHTDAAAGISTILITPADTRAVEPGNYFYSIKIDMASDDVTVYELDEGRFVLDADPTNRAA